LINHQKESVAPPIKPSRHSAEENSVSRLQKLEEDKQRALVASSRMLAINRGPVLAQTPLAPAAPSLPVATSNLSNLLPGGVSTIPAGLSTKARTVLAEGRGEAEASPVRPRNLTPLTPNNPASQRLVFEGTLIPAVLLTQITSDLPGMITAQVTEDVYDSLHGSFLAIPKGSRLIGEYASHVITGQERITASFHRLILPKGQSFSLETMQAADSVGQSGMQDEVDSRFWKRLGGQFMTAGLARILTPSSGGITILGGSGNTLGLDAAGQILVDTTRSGFQGNASLGPVIVIKKGYPFVILVNQDMDFATVRP
jgi:type IV secretion system protein VirB10